MKEMTKQQQFLRYKIRKTMRSDHSREPYIEQQEVFNDRGLLKHTSLFYDTLDTSEVEYKYDSLDRLVFTEGDDQYRRFTGYHNDTDNINSEFAISDTGDILTATVATYDDNGNVTMLVDRNYGYTQYRYDEENRLVERALYNTNNRLIVSSTFEYEPNEFGGDTVTQITHYDSNTLEDEFDRFVKDAQGKELIWEFSDDYAGNYGKCIYEYNENGDRIRSYLEITSLEDKSLLVAYKEDKFYYEDGVLRKHTENYVDEVYPAAGYSTVWEYNEYGVETRIEYSGGTVVEYVYEDAFIEEDIDLCISQD